MDCACPVQVAEPERQTVAVQAGLCSELGPGRTVTVVGPPGRRRGWFTSVMTSPHPDPDPLIDPDEPVPDDPGELLPDAPTELPPPPIEPTPGDPGGDPAGVPEPV